jgi:hypothetical protein
MTGLEHYAEAERLIAIARTDPGRPELYCNSSQAQIAHILADAQVHATLAIAAATATASGAWDAVTKPPPPTIVFE